MENPNVLKYVTELQRKASTVGNIYEDVHRSWYSLAGNNAFSACYKQ